MPQQGDFGFWSKNDGVNLSVVEAAKYKRAYGIITPDILAEIFDRRMLTADLLSHSRDKKEAFWARLVLHTLTAVKKELEGKIA